MAGIATHKKSYPFTAVCLVASAMLALVVPLPARAADPPTTPDSSNWVANGTVRAIARLNGTTYIGGDFTRIGQPVGQGASISTLAPGAYDPVYPKVTGGSILAVAPDGSGGWFIGGSFTYVGGVARNRLAHIKSDKTLDAAWNPNASNTVNAIAVSGTTVYTGGAFTTVGGQPRNHIAALDRTTGNATAWNPNADNTVNAIAVSGTTVYTGGAFTTVGGQPRNYIAALDTTTGNATAWNPNANNTVNTIAVSGDGSTVYTGGAFTTVGGQPRNYIAAIDAGTGNATNWNPNANDTVNTIAVGSGGVPSIYVGGTFTTLNGGTVRNRIAAISSAATGTVTTWNPNANGTVNAIALSGSNVYVGGAFTTVGGQARNYIAAIDAGTGNATAWVPNPDAAVQALGVGASTVYAGGDFITFGGLTRKRLASFDPNGNLTGWNPAADNTVNTIAVSGSTVYVGGSFTTFTPAVIPITRNHIAAIDAAGTGTVTGWNPNADNTVNAIAVSGATFYVGGDFTTIGGQTRNRIAALDAGTGLATAWNPNADNTVNTIAVSGSTVYAGGSFATLNGGTATRNHIAAIDATTSTATAWDPNANDTVNTIAVSGSTVYAGGKFTTLSGGATTRNHIAAVDSTTGNATAWNPNADNTVNTIAVSGSNVYAGGSFATIGSSSRSGLAALDTTTANATAWNPSPTATPVVQSLYAAGSTAYAGGGFSAMGSNMTGRYASFSTAPVNTIPPSVLGGTGGYAGVGQMLTCQNGAWDNDPSTYAYMWKRESTPIPGAGLSTYVTQNGDVGHSLSCRVTATNRGGSSAADSSNSIFVDGTPPDTTITSNPSDPSNDASPSFDFTSTEQSSTFECKLDSEPLYALCPNPKSYANLANGLHTFYVRAKDLAGNIDPTPATHTWTIDTTPPDTVIDPPLPANPTNQASSTFDYHASPTAADNGYECRVDGTADDYVACGSGASASHDTGTLSDGQHTFYVRAKDALGNTDLTPATHTWTVDTQAPDTTIDSHPANPTDSTSASFGFSSTGQGSTFECKLDSGTYASCSNPKDFADLADGPHAFYVRAKDALGNTDPTPATYTWTIDTRPPSTTEPDTRAPGVTILSGPPSATREVDALFAFAADETRVGFVCRLDDEEWAPCESPEVVHGLTPGRHAFSVKAEDRAGNWSDEVEWSWVVDRRAPSVTRKNVKRGAVVPRRAFHSIRGIAGDDYDGDVRVKVKLQIMNPTRRLDEGECAYLSLKSGHRIVHRCGIALTRVEGGDRWRIPVLARVRARMSPNDRYALLLRTVDHAGNTRFEKVRFKVR